MSSLEVDLSNLSQLREKGIFIDIIFKISDKSIPAHRVIVANTCDYFKSMLLSAFKESNSNIIELKDINPDAFEHVIRAIYGEALIVDDFEGNLEIMKMLVFLQFKPEKIRKFIEKIPVPPSKFE